MLWAKAGTPNVSPVLIVPFPSRVAPSTSRVIDQSVLHAQARFQEKLQLKELGRTYLTYVGKQFALSALFRKTNSIMFLRASVKPVASGLVILRRCLG